MLYDTLRDAGHLDDYEESLTKLEKLVKKGSWSEAMDVFNNMRDQGLRLKMSAYKAALNACQALHSASNAWRIVQEMRKGKVSLDEGMYRAAVQTCTQWENVLRLFEEMKEEGFSPRAEDYNAVIRQLAWGQELFRSLGVLEEMRCENIAPNRDTYKAVLHVCEKCQETDRALAFLRQMEEEGIELNAEAYSFAISASFKQQKWQQILALVEEMEARKVPGELNYWQIIGNTAMNACCNQGGTWMQALQMLKMMLRRGVPADTFTLVPLITACGRDGEWARALAIMSAAQEKGFKPGQGTWTAAVGACGTAEEWRAALALFENVRRPSLAAYENVMQACVGKWQLALSLQTDLVWNKIAPSVGTYSTLIHTCGRSNWNMSLKVLGEMKRRGLTPNIDSYGAAIHSCKSAGEWEQVLALMQEMTGSKVDPDLRVIEDAVSAFSKAVGSFSKEQQMVIAQELEERRNELRQEQIRKETAARNSGAPVTKKEASGLGKLLGCENSELERIFNLWFSPLFPEAD